MLVNDLVYKIRVTWPHRDPLNQSQNAEEQVEFLGSAHHLTYFSVRKMIYSYSVSVNYGDRPLSTRRCETTNVPALFGRAF